MDNWARLAAGQILDEYSENNPGLFDRYWATSQAQIAKIIMTHAEPLMQLLRDSRYGHHETDSEGDLCEKVNYLDGLHSCTCGADEWNARIDAALGEKP